MEKCLLTQINTIVKKLNNTKFDSSSKQAGNKILAVICKDGDVKKELTNIIKMLL